MVDVEVELFPGAVPVALPVDPSVVVTVTVTVSGGGGLLEVEGIVFNGSVLPCELRIFSARAYTPLAPATPMTPIITIFLTNSRLSNRLIHLGFVLGNRYRCFLASHHLLQLIPDV